MQRSVREVAKLYGSEKSFIVEVQRALSGLHSTALIALYSYARASSVSSLIHCYTLSLTGIKHGSSGFDFDSNTNVVTVSPDVWNEYLKGNEGRCSCARRRPRGMIQAGRVTLKWNAQLKCHPSLSRTTTPDGNGNPSKKKKNKVIGDTYMADQMVVAGQVVASEIKVSKALNVEHEMCVLFLATMGEVNELNDVEKANYGSKIMGRVEHMTVFVNLKSELRYDWVHAIGGVENSVVEANKLKGKYGAQATAVGQFLGCL
ncbi:hypothetical protein Syun_017233 [Stephania yunnanensis]|uniref:Uncharacterized protein n=1 Tax=Stephania yunnanensis TaxID=152371 RepID=A0AAP0J6J8_9MAGN